MSRIDELKKQYPELNISIIDLIKTFDKTKSYKYTPLICKIISANYLRHYDETNDSIRIKEILKERGFVMDEKTSFKEHVFYNLLTDYLDRDTTNLLTEFMDYMESNKIQNKDLTKYKTVDNIREAISLAQLKEFEKDLEGHVIREHEDENWICVRPLTFSASAKYGATTKWCTTAKNEKSHFERYWRRGILVYFINKKTGYKFAGFKTLIPHDDEFSFWSAQGSRIDFLHIDIEDYMYPIIKKIFRSQKTNKELTSDEIQEVVHIECLEELKFEKEYEEPSIVAHQEQPIRQLNDGDFMLNPNLLIDIVDDLIEIQ